MSRSVNMAIIVGNLTRDPEMRYTPQGHAVTSFGVATNRRWVAEGVEKDDVEFHNVVAWNKLAEICNEFLAKGRKVYIQGRLQTRTWDGQDGVKRNRTEIVADDMVLLDNRRPGESGPETGAGKKTEPAPATNEVKDELKAGKSSETVEKKVEKEVKEPVAEKLDEEVGADEIPF